MPPDPRFWSDVERHLLRYGPAFTPEVIDRDEPAEGLDILDRALAASG